MPKKIVVTENKKFTTAAMLVAVKLPLTRRNLAYATLVSRINNIASANFPTTERLHRAYKTAYDFEFYSQPITLGSCIIMQYWINFIEPAEVLDPDYNLDILAKFTNVLITGQSTDEAVIKQAKADLQEDYQTFEQNPSSYAVSRFFERFYRLQPDYAADFLATKEDVLNADSKSVSEFLDQLADEPTLVVINTRNHNAQQILSSVMQAEDEPSCDFTEPNIVLKVQNEAEQYAENRDFQQEQLLMGYELQQDLNAKSRLVLNVIAHYLAGDESSRLFTQVRENLGAAYSIDATSYAFNRLLLVSAPIDPSYHEQVMQIVQQEMNNLANGLIDEQLFAQTKRQLLEKRLIRADIQSTSLTRVLYQELLGEVDTEKFEVKLNAVNASDIQEMAKQLVLKESYILR